MPSWFKITMSHEELAAGKHIVMQDQFVKLFVANAGPRDAGMYQKKDSQIHEYFFPPGSVRIALPLLLSYSGVPCEAPIKSEVRGLVSQTDSEVPFSHET